VMNRTHRFQNAVPYSGICLFLILISIPIMAQTDAGNKEVPVRINLRADKETIMLGEPLFIAFEVTNLSGEKLCLGIGGDYRNRFGRPDSFKVSVTAENGTAVPQPEVSNGGGFIGCAWIESGETYTVRLFLSHWATITSAGSYYINVKRHMGFSNSESSETGKPKYSMVADVTAKFTVVPVDENKMGAIINSLGSVMLDISDPSCTESATALASIHDKRVISYFAEAARKFSGFEFGFDHTSETIISTKAIAALARYDDDRAIQALEAVMNSSGQDTRLDVATAFGNTPHKDGIKLLLKMQDDPYYFVRLRVAQGLEKVNTKESLVVLRKLLKDENEHVRNAAKETLKQLEGTKSN